MYICFNNIIIKGEVTTYTCVVCLVLAWMFGEVHSCQLTLQKKWIKHPEDFSQKCQKLAKIGLKMYFMCFYSFCSRDSVASTGEWEIWSVSGRVSIDV